MKISLFLPVALALALLAGCVTPPTPGELKSAHYGSYPSNYLSTLDPLMDSRHQQMGDPFQVMSITHPQKDWMGDTGSRTWGYSVVVLYQAPNPSVNATVYNYREKFFFRNRKVIAFQDVTNMRDVLGAVLQNNTNATAAASQ